MNEHRPGSDPQTEHRVLARPLGRRIAQTRDADPARQSPLDGSLHEFGREEGERDCHIDLPKAAFVPRGNLLDSGDGAGNDLSKPTSAARDRVLPGPPRSPMRNAVSRSLTKSPQFAGIFAGSDTGHAVSAAR